MIYSWTKGIIFILLASCMIVLFLSIGSQSYGVTKTSESIDVLQKQEIEMLKSQVNTMNEFTDDILETVYWSLGTVAAIAMLLIGFGWFANFKIYERDKNTMMQELENIIARKIESTKVMLREVVSKEIVRSLEGTHNKMKQNEAQLSSRIKEIEYDISDIRYHWLEFQAKQWADQEVYHNVSTIAIDMLKIASEKEDKYLIGETLDFLEKYLPKTEKLDTIFSSELTKVLDGLPTSFSQQVKKVKGLY